MQQQDLVPWGARGLARLDRHHRRVLAAIDRTAEEAETRVGAMASVTEHAQLTLAHIDRVRQMATQMAPDTAEMQMLLEVDAWMEMRSVIRGMGRRLR